MTLPIQAPALKNMEMKSIVTLEIMSPWNAILATISIALRDKQRYESVTGLEIADSYSNIKDGLGGNADNSGAADVLYIQRSIAQRLGNTRTLLSEPNCPLFADYYEL